MLSISCAFDMQPVALDHDWLDGFLAHALNKALTLNSIIVATSDSSYAYEVAPLQHQRVYDSGLVIKIMQHAG